MSGQQVFCREAAAEAGGAGQSESAPAGCCSRFQHIFVHLIHFDGGLRGLDERFLAKAIFDTIGVATTVAVLLAIGVWFDAVIHDRVAADDVDREGLRIDQDPLFGFLVFHCDVVAVGAAELIAGKVLGARVSWDCLVHQPDDEGSPALWEPSHSFLSGDGKRLLSNLRAPFRVCEGIVQFADDRQCIWRDLILLAGLEFIEPHHVNRLG